jgi:hypothetical protein
MLTVALLVFVHQMKSEETDQEVQLICPDGWIAYQVHYYSCGYLPLPQNIYYPKSNCSTCLTCKRNSILEHSFRLVELCAVFQPRIITSLNYLIQPEKCTGNICKELYHQPFCGMSLTMSNYIINSETLLPCQNDHHDIQDNSQSIELVCSKSYSFKTLLERDSACQNQQPTNTRSFCLTCDHNSVNVMYGEKLKITMCSSHFYPDDKIFCRVTDKNLLECQQQDQSQCEPNTISPIQKGLHCGLKLTGSRYHNSVIISNYIPCDSEKTNTQVMLNLLY